MTSEKKLKKIRIDKLLVDLGLVKSRERAKALIMAGKVFYKEERINKPGTDFSPDLAEGLIVKEDNPFVSRGGLKLKGALEEFKKDVTNSTVIDIGSSTGGFTDCVLQLGAKKVFAVDVGKGLLDYNLRNDERVVVLEGENFRYLDYEKVGEKSDLAVMDLSFISLEKILEKVKEFLKDGGEMLCLVKPQFEVGKGQVGKGGIVKDPEKHAQVMGKISAFATDMGLKVLGSTMSPIKGAKGNVEFWLWLKV